ncbi:hypothetical protein [Streptomyces sp. NPDC007369]|uniref:hypothetical protein n=1 Tax=Streptomyces sp. NPDC007369 TaxID=3154589 RepID=UPI0033E6F04A
MTKTMRGLFPAALAGVLLLGGATAATATTTTASAAASCTGGAWKYDKPSGLGYAPAGSGYYVTTNRCADIQVKPDQDTDMQLCYLKNRNPNDEVCKSRVSVKTGRWTVLGTGFNDGVYFYFKFPNKGAHKTGLVAA